MQITDVKTFLVHDRARPERNYAFVKIYTDEGLTGLGEAGINGKEHVVCVVSRAGCPAQPVPFRCRRDDRLRAGPRSAPDAGLCRRRLPGQQR